MLRPKTPMKQQEKFSFRQEAWEGDEMSVRRLCQSTGFFSEEEIEVAGELVEAYLKEGKASGYNFIFCEADGHLIGYSCFGRICLTESSFDLYWIVVEKAWQGKGLGKKILEMTETAAIRLGCKRIYAETSSRRQYQPTVSFYENQGYFNEATIADFYRPGDAKLIFVKVLGE